MRRFIRSIVVLLGMATLAACTSPGAISSYEAGLKANVDQYRLYSDTQLAQQQTLQACYAHNPNKSECSILTASTNAQQTLAGQPQALRVARSPGEIAESIVNQGFDATVKVYGITAIRDAVKSNAEAFASAAQSSAQLQAEISQAGISAASKPPVILTVPAGGSASILE